MKLRKLILTAIMLALLIGTQFVTRSLTQFVTGTLVNLILLVAVFTAGLGGGLVVAVVSNALAFLAGIGPALPQVVPFVAAANVILVSVAYLVRKHVAEKGAKNKALAAAGLVAAGAAKTAFLWVGL
ncbi:MAG: ECF transporter S component, partial [Firmicutes bacterium]|nr:ECF transporter S component [Bacillota bacterium]